MITLTKGDMQGLIDAFPSLRRLNVKWGYLNNSDWCAQQLPSFSSGEQLAVQFVKFVWNHHLCSFDLAQAVNRWDAAHYEVFKAWTNDPWFM